MRRDAELGPEVLSWLQSELLEVCAARLSVTAPPPEPVALFSQRRGRACPLAPMTRRQIRAANTPLFLRLLRVLRLQVGVEWRGGGESNTPLFLRLLRVLRLQVGVERRGGGGGLDS